MRCIRYLGAALGAALTLCAVAAPMAQAGPEFYNCIAGGIVNDAYQVGCLIPERGGAYRRGSLDPAEIVAFLSKVGTTELVGSEAAVKCSGGSSTGDISGPLGAAKIVAKLTGCELAGALGCKINTPLASAGEIVTAALKGKLGLVTASEATSRVGLSLEPESGSSTEFSTVEGSCIGESRVAFQSTTSRIIGEVTPVNLFGTTGELVFKRSGTGQLIKTFEGAGETKDSLEFLGAKVGLSQLKDGLIFEEMLETLW